MPSTDATEQELWAALHEVYLDFIRRTRNSLKKLLFAFVNYLLVRKYLANKTFAEEKLRNSCLCFAKEYKQIHI